MHMQPTTFNYNHPSPSKTQLESKARLAAAFVELLVVVQSYSPEGSYRDRAVARLEEANLSATRGIFHHDDGSFRIYHE